MGAIKNFFDRLAKSKDPVQYWRKKGMKIGEGCEIYSSADFGSEPYLIAIGDRVRINGGVRLITHDGGVWVRRHLRGELSDIDLFGEIKIGNNVHIGTNSIIMPNVSIGDNCIIGCGAIVTKDIPSNSVAVGVPAKVIESIDDYAQKHINDFVDTKHLSASQKREFILKEIINANTK